MIKALPPRFRLQSLGGAESCYRIAIEDLHSGKKGRGYLTYELSPNRAEYRNVVVTNCDWLIEHDSELALYYRAFLKELDNSSRRQREPAQFTEAAKFLVNALATGAKSSERLRVVVHRFGPVPAFCLDYKLQLKVHRREVRCIIALFPDHKPKYGRLPRAPYTPFFMGSKGELRESLRIVPSLIFQRYFEDVAEDFHDLRRTVRDRDVLRRAKQAEKRLAESIKAKLKVLIPSKPLGHSNDWENKMQWSYFIEHDSLLYEAAYGRALALFLLNELYPTKGIASRSDDYRDLLHGLRERFVDLLGRERVDVIEATSRDYRFLKECFSTYAAAATDRSNSVMLAERLRTLAGDALSLWQEEFCKFAAFVLLVRFMVEAGSRTRMFISYHYDVPISEISRDFVRGVVQNRFGPKVDTVFLPPMPPETSFRHVARAAIWASHGTLAICPANTKAINLPADKDYKWIARETEYTLLLRKDVLFGIEKGLALDKLSSDLENADIGYLVTGSKLPPDKQRAKALVRHFKEKVHVPFQIIGVEPRYTAPELETGLEQFLTSLSESTIEGLLDGYLTQFTPDSQKTIIVVLKTLGRLGKGTRSGIVSQIADQWPDAATVFGGKEAKPASAKEASSSRVDAVRIWDNAFQRMWVTLKERRIDLGAKGVSLLAFRNHYYRERLSLVFRTYLPQTDGHRLNFLAKQWLTRWLVKFGFQGER